MKNILFLLLGSLIVSCGFTDFTLSSPNAPTPDDLVSSFQVDSFLSGIGVPVDRSFYPVLDSMPNRSYFGPMGFLFKKRDTLINTILCNADYPKIHKSIAFYDKPKYWYSDHTLKDELKSIREISIDSLPVTDYYLVLYWSLVTDNLSRRNITALERLRKEEVSLTVIYVNMNNREEYDFRINNRNMMKNNDQDYYFKKK